MSISCALGLVACLTFNEKQFPKDTVFEVLDTCGVVSRLPASSFEGANGMGIAVMDALDDAGIETPWPRGSNKGAQRRAMAALVCAQFEAAFNNPRNWSE